MKPKRVQKIPTKYRKDVEVGLSKVAKAIKDAREGKKLTQETLAEDLDISVISLMFIEQGRRFPSLPLLFYILEKLNLKFEIR